MHEPFEPETHFSADPETARLEREAIEELAETARRHVKRLPMESAWRDVLIDVSDLAAVFRLSALSDRLDPSAAGSPGPTL